MTSTATAAWRAETDADGIVWLSFDKPGTSTNVLSRDTLVELGSHLEELDEVAAARSRDPLGEGRRVSSPAPTSANSRSSTSAEQAFELVRAAQKIFDRLEALPCPTVAIINGFALGGGFELALACRYRVGVKSDKFSIGLPEVMLGIHPGFGGTVRAVRRAGVRTAMEMMLTGKTLRADKAKRAGFVDRLVFPADAEAAAREFISRRAEAAQAATARSRAVLAAAARPREEAAHRAGARQSPPGTLSGALRHHRPVGEVRRARRSRVRSRSALHRRTHARRDLAQSGARVHAAGAAQESRRQEQAAARARARGRRGCHGRRHRRVVRAARPQRHAAGSRTQVHRTGACSARAKVSKSASRTSARPRSS